MADKVNLIIAGVQKGGTTALSDTLRDHPEVAVPEAKECHLFDYPSKYRDAVASGFATYHAYFAGMEDRPIWLDATPIYMYLKEVPAMIRAYSSEARIIVSLRNPIERAFSHYKMEVGREYESLPFEDALAAEEDRLAAPQDPEDIRSGVRCHSYLDRGRYYRQLTNLEKSFPREQILVLLAEDLRHQHDEVLREVQQFARVNYHRLDQRESNVGGSREAMSVEARDFLRSQLAEDVAMLKHWLGRDLREWKDFS